MIDAIDEALWRWAKELHSPDGVCGAATPLSHLIDNRGELIRSTAILTGGLSVDIELLMNKRLPADLKRLAHIRYVEEIHPPWLELGISRRTYFRRVSLLHAAIKELMMQRRAA